MHDIWNPWHGCRKISEGCYNCYMMYLDQKHQIGEGTVIYKTKSFNYPLSTNKDGNYKIKSGELIRVCMNSDFFVEEADIWRDEAWRIIKKRSDVKFFLLTKRPQRVKNCLPSDWKGGYENVFFNITCENQSRAEERIPFLKDLPFHHKGIMVAPMLGPMNIEQYLRDGFIEQVICGGENYGGSRLCNYDWVVSLASQCKKYNITFAFTETGSKFMKDGKIFHLENKKLQSKMAFKSQVSFLGKESSFILRDPFENILDKNKLYVPKYTSIYCDECGSRIICNGCANCGKCKQKINIEKH